MVMNVRGIVDSVVEVVGPLARLKGLNVASRCDADVPAHINGDGRLVEQVLLELVQSAVKNTEAGFVAISARRVLQIDGSAVIELLVRDTGAAQRETDTADSRRLAGQVNGRLEGESVTGSGTTVRFMFPAQQPEESAGHAAGWAHSLPDGA